MSQPLKYSLWVIVIIWFAGYNITIAQKKGNEVGQQAPNIKLRNPEGKTYALYDLRGKMVLVDFWASWCKPCRQENPNIVNAYNQYKNQLFKEGDGFTVFSVSLDRKAAKWKQAIKNDKLTWPYHVSDLAGWNSRPAYMYSVFGIPANFLINSDGIIIARNLRGEELIRTLESLKK